MDKFFIDNELYYEWFGVKLAYVKFEVEDGILTILSTFVDSSLRGQGIAKLLMEDIESFAKEKGYKIKAICSYAVKYFSEGNHPLYLG